VQIVTEGGLEEVEMALSSNRFTTPYYEYGNDKLRQELRSFFSHAIEGNEKLKQLEGIKTTADWYRQQKDFREKLNQENGNRGAVIFSAMGNEMIEMLQASIRISQIG
jgi:hypothetical protein